MENEVFAGIIIAAISGLYYAIYKNHGCIKRIETKLDAHFDMEYVKEEITTLKQYVQDMHNNDK